MDCKTSVVECHPRLFMVRLLARFTLRIGMGRTSIQCQSRSISMEQVDAQFILRDIGDIAVDGMGGDHGALLRNGENAIFVR